VNTREAQGIDSGSHPIGKATSRGRWPQGTVGRACTIRDDLRLPINAEVRRTIQGPYPYYGPTGQLDAINEFRLDGEYALIGEDGDHFLKFRERPMTLFVIGKCNVNNHAHVIANSSLCYAKWFYYCFLHRDLFRALTRQGVGRYKLTRAALERLTLPLPTKQQQNYMIGILDRLELGMRTLDSLRALKHSLKRGLMQQLLSGRKRFTEFRDRPWHFSPLESHVTQVTRRNIDDLQVVLTASGEHGLVDQRRYFNRRVAGTDLTKYYLLRKGEFAYNRSAMIGYPFGATKRLDHHEAGALSTLYLCFSISDSGLDSDYLKHVFESGVLSRQLRPIARVGARAHGLLNVTDEDFLSISIPLPEPDEQRRIAEILNTADKELELLTAQRELIEREKRALLSRFLSGDVAMAV
jgi:type I restriction enzyme S subunit